MSNDKEGLFGKITYPELINWIRRKIDEYNSFPISKVLTKDKPKTIVVNNVSYTEHNLGNTPCLLLSISAFSTNMANKYFEGETKIQITPNNKIGSEDNYVLLYPRIVGLNSNEYSYYFLMLVYEDPDKDKGEVSRLAKMVAKNVLGMPVENVKLPTILKELEEMGNVSELQIHYTCVGEPESGVGVEYAQYLIKSSLTRKKARNFQDLPFCIAQDLLNDTSDDEDYTSKNTTIRVGKKEYKIKREVDEARELLKETAEKIYNATTSISKEEYQQKLYDQSFMLDKINGVLRNYLSSEI